MSMSVPAAPVITGDAPSGFVPEYSVEGSPYVGNVEIRDDPKFVPVELALVEEAETATVATQKVEKQPVRTVPRNEVSSLRAHWGQLNAQYSGNNNNKASSGSKRYSPLSKVTRYIQHPSLLELSQKQGGGPVSKPTNMKFSDYISLLQANEQETDKITYNVQLVEVYEAPVQAPKPKPVYSIHYFTVDHDHAGPNKESKHLMATLDSKQPDAPEKQYVYPQYADEPVWIPQNLVKGEEQQKHVDSHLPLTPIYKDEWDAEHSEDILPEPVKEGPGSNGPAPSEATINPVVTVASTDNKATSFLETSTKVTARRRPAITIPNFLVDPHLIEMEFAKLDEPAAARPAEDL